MEKLRDAIRETTRGYLEKGGMILGQCLSAVGWVNNTVPNVPEGIVELPMTDVAGAGFAVGAAVAGRRPILVLRFGDFLLLNNSPIFNFAAKRKDIFGKPVPLFVRVISQEGKGTGLSHSGKPHAMTMHFPGMRVWCPITPKEWIKCWKEFNENTDPMMCFEHRATYDNVDSAEYEDKIYPDADVTIFAISLARRNAIEAAKSLEEQGVKVNLIHIYKLKPFCSKQKCLQVLSKTRVGIVVDSSYETCGASRDIAYQLMAESDVITKVVAVGLEDISVGCSSETENATPSVSRIVGALQRLVT